MRRARAVAAGRGRPAALASTLRLALRQHQVTGTGSHPGGALNQQAGSAGHEPHLAHRLQGTSGGGHRLKGKSRSSGARNISVYWPLAPCSPLGGSSPLAGHRPTWPLSDCTMFVRKHWAHRTAAAPSVSHIFLTDDGRRRQSTFPPHLNLALGLGIGWLQVQRVCSLAVPKSLDVTRPLLAP